MNEIPVKIETKIVETKIRKIEYTLSVGEPVFIMSNSVYNWYVRKYKNQNFVKRLKKNGYK